jgi:hypothetical protein
VVCGLSHALNLAQYDQVLALRPTPMPCLGKEPESGPRPPGAAPAAGGAERVPASRLGCWRC